MSTAPPPPAPMQTTSALQEITIVSHCGVFYWWPVWAVGLLMGLLTWFDGALVAVVPADTEARRNWEIVTGSDAEGKKETASREGYVLPLGKHLFPNKPEKAGEPLPKPDEPHLRMARHSSYGVLFATTLLLVITITNVPLRGLWSLVVIIGIILVAVIFALAGWWDAIFRTIGLLDIRINLGGYLFISLALLGIWLVTTFIFDKQIYMVFTPGQLRVCQEIGGGETAYDTSGMVTQKERSDLFRHWILGLGSGDLVVRTAGAHQHEFRLPNVLFISRKLQMIEQMQRDRPVVRGSV